MRGSWASIPTQGGPPFFFDWSFEHQFDSSLRTLSETIGKWVLLMWGVGTLWGAVITDKTTKLKILIPMWPTVATKWDHAQLFLESQKNCLIRLHYSTFAYTHLVTNLYSSTPSNDSSTLVYIRLHSSVTHLHSSTLHSSTE